MRTLQTSRWNFFGLPLLLGAAIGLDARAANAQIKEPGSHPKYAFEIEPHLLVDWSDDFWGGDGIGIGARVSIPIIDNGPVPRINNNFAIGFGFDWAHFSGDCWGWGPFFPGPNPPARNGAYDCTGNNFWFPVNVQWNFFFTPVVTAFAEGGLAIRFSSWSADYPCNGGAFCNESNHDVGVDPLFAVGGRFLLSNSFGLTVRLGWPYLSLGASFLL